jgi:molybdopterin converting factor small subunit
MSLAQEDIEFIKKHLGEWLTEVSLGKPPAVYEIELRERMVRVEEALKHQGELIQQLIQQMDKRFEQVDKRFEQMDQRFVELQRRMDRFMFWSLGMTLTVGGIVIAVLKF